MYFKNDLTEKEYETLKYIYEYGGYVRVKFLEENFENVDYNTLYRRLENLADGNKKYLTKRKFWSDSRKEPITYQITKKGCSIIDNPNSHYRQKHKIQYSHRALIKSLFCFEQHNKLKDYLITNHDKRKSIFEKYNFDKNFFPRKYNKDDSFVHFEEFIFDFTSTDLKLELYHKDKVVYDNSVPNIIIIHIDKNESSISIQLDNLIKRYEDMINSCSDIAVNFLIVTDKLTREIAYKKEIRDKFFNKSNYKTSTRLLSLYYNFLKKCYGNDEKMLIDLDERFTEGSLENELNERGKIEVIELNSELNSLKNKFIMGDFKDIVEHIKAIANGIGSYRKSIELVDIFIDNLLKLEYNGYLDLGGNFGFKHGIKTYIVSERIV